MIEQASKHQAESFLMTNMYPMKNNAILEQLLRICYCWLMSLKIFIPHGSTLSKRSVDEQAYHIGFDSSNHLFCVATTFNLSLIVQFAHNS